MDRWQNYIPAALFLAMSTAAYFGNPPHVILKLLALFTIFWFGPIIVLKGIRGSAVTWDVFAVVSAAGVALVWSFGWLP
mgnify:CR=1 FL=1